MDRVPAITRAAIALAMAVSLLAVAGCGDDEGGAGGGRVIVALDFTPNAVHAPLYAAVRKRYDRDEDVQLKIRPPGSRPDSLRLLAARRADLAVLDIHDLAIAREQGTDVVAVAALVQRPLAALIVRPGVRRPRELEGRRVGVSGLPSDPAFVDAIVEHDGGDPEKIREITIGFSAVSSLIARKIDGVPAFWNAEGVTLRQRGVQTREFRVEDYGAPVYPEVVLVATRRTLESRRDAIRAALAAIRRGTEETLAHPEPAAREIARAAGESDLRLVRAQMQAVAGARNPPLVLDRQTLDRWADFDARIGIVKERPDVERAFDTTLAR